MLQARALVAGRQHLYSLGKRRAKGCPHVRRQAGRLPSINRLVRTWNVQSSAHRRARYTMTFDKLPASDERIASGGGVAGASAAALAVSALIRKDTAGPLGAVRVAAASSFTGTSIVAIASAGTDRPAGAPLAEAVWLLCMAIWPPSAI